MVQNWTEEPFELSNEGETDLQNMENNFKTLKSTFSGASYGLNTEAGSLWYDTNTPILTSNDGLLKIRKQGDDGWLGVLALAQESNNGLIWFHGDDMSNQEGWVIDTQIVEDRVMALKNHGSGTYTVGRAVAGDDLVIDDHDPHTHILATRATTTGGFIGSKAVAWVDYFGDLILYAIDLSGGSAVINYVKPTTDSPIPGAITHPDHDAGQFRIKAQVGIVIYPDI